MPVQPVIAFTADDIQAKGYNTLGEFLQNLPFDSGTMNSEFTTLSPLTSAVTVNPRGLGSNHALALVNGRRALPYALVDNAIGKGQSVFNFNSIPAAAVERVEFLKDGASAIYGSDAISGVFNVILKKRYSGSVLDLGLSNTLKHDSLWRSASVFTGLSDRGWEISVGGTYQSRNANVIQDFGISSADYSHLAPRGTNLLLSGSYPATVNISAAQAAAAGVPAGYYVIPGAVPAPNPTRSIFVNVGPTSTSVPAENRYDVTRDHRVYPHSEGAAAFVNVDRRITSTLGAFAQATFNRVHTDHELMPVSAGATLPPANPYNPFGGPVTIQYWTGGALTHRVTGNRTTTIVGGFSGTVANTWHWQASATYGVDQVTRESDALRAADFNAALSATNRASALNPFGPSEDRELPARLITRSRDFENKADTVGCDLVTSARLWSIPLENAGQVGIASGYEFRREVLYVRPNPSTSPVLRYTGRRETHAVFAEVSLPLKRWLEVQLAGRYDDYSDVGNTTSPKVAALLRLPGNNVINALLRGSYSESFKAPDLGQINQTQLTNYRTAAVTDPLRPQDPAVQLGVLRGGNPDLNPENAKGRYVGTVVEIPALKGLSLSVDFFETEIRDTITSELSASYILSAEGRARLPNAIVREPSGAGPGRILQLLVMPQNGGQLSYRGLDYGIRYSPPTTRFGTFAFAADATNILSARTDMGIGGGLIDTTGRYFSPEWRGSLGASWKNKNLGAAINSDIIGKYFNNGFVRPGWGENVYPTVHPSIWQRWRGFVFTVGANNVFDRRPPPNSRSWGAGSFLYGFDDRAYGAGALGRSVYVHVRKEL